MPKDRRESALVIGAGPSGIVAAKYLLESTNPRYDVTILEQQEQEPPPPPSASSTASSTPSREAWASSVNSKAPRLLTAVVFPSHRTPTTSWMTGAH